MRNDFRPRTGEERESAKFGSDMARVKKVIISVSAFVCTMPFTSALLTIVFSTASKPRGQKAKEHTFCSQLPRERRGI
jgi:hypothetical protein